MFCSNCGFNNADDADFCQQCGNKLTAPAAPVTEPAPAPEVAEAAPAAEPAPVEQAPVTEPFAETVTEPIVTPSQPEPVNYAAPPVAPNPAGMPPFAAGQGNMPPVAPPPVYVPQPQYQTPVYNNYQPVYAAPVQRKSGPVVDAVKKVCGSPLFLIATIAVTVAVIFDFIGFANLMVEFDDFNYLFRVTDAFGSVIGIYAVVNIIAGILSVAGLWVAFGSAKSSAPGMKTAGLSLLKAVAIIRLVLMSITFFVIEVLCISTDMSFRNVFGFSSDEIIAFAVIFAILFIFIIIYYAKAISALGAAKTTAVRAMPVSASAFLAILLFIMASLTALCFAGFASDEREGLYYLYEYCLGGIEVVAVSMISIIAAMICFGILIFKYRSAIGRFASPRVAPAVQPVYQGGGYYPPQPYGYQPPQAPPQAPPQNDPRYY